MSQDDLIKSLGEAMSGWPLLIIIVVAVIVGLVSFSPILLDADLLFINRKRSRKNAKKTKK
ncbi:hypothetical protein CR956_00275 [Candidatus Saccharibacteria bacterium]|nr:MAG: hypothetical protein CR956_00275 [Candidatus Saccharibacteria bacterium]